MRKTLSENKNEIKIKPDKRLLLSSSNKKLKQRMKPLQLNYDSFSTCLIPPMKHDQFSNLVQLKVNSEVLIESVTDLK